MDFRYPFVMEKVCNWSELHLSEVTFYKIHVLEKQRQMAKFMLANEIWCHIFSYLDEKSLRTIASTCNFFLELVRGNEKLSGCIVLKSVRLKDLATKIKNSEWIWDRWPSLKTLKIPIQFEDLTGLIGSTDQLTETELFDLIRDMKFETCPTLEMVVLFNCCLSRNENYDLIELFDGLRAVNLMEFSFHPKDVPLFQSWKHITVHICWICLIRYRNYPEKDILPNAQLQKSKKPCKYCLDWCLSKGFIKRKEQ